MENFKLLAVALLLTTLSSSAFAARQVIEKELDFSLAGQIPKANEMYFSYTKDPVPYDQWLQRRSSGPLMVNAESNQTPLPTEVFEAHAAGIVNRPISAFTAEALHNINTVKRMDPQNLNEQLPSTSGKFTLQTTVQFPPSWSAMVFALKKATVLTEDKTDKIIVKSEFSFIDVKNGQANPSRDAKLALLSISPRKPDAVNFQAMVQINQIARFGSIVSLYYGVDPQHTLVVNYFTLGIKKKDLDKGIDKINVRALFKGTFPELNTKSGIGAGLPVYSRDLLLSMLEAWN